MLECVFVTYTRNSASFAGLQRHDGKGYGGGDQWEPGFLPTPGPPVVCTCVFANHTEREKLHGPFQAPVCSIVLKVDA